MAASDQQSFAAVFSHKDAEVDSLKAQLAQQIQYQRDLREEMGRTVRKMREQYGPPLP
jgi:hypothetical protein